MASIIQEFKLYLKLAFPLIVSYLALKVMQTIDTLMMGWLGAAALAAGALATSIFTLILFFCRGTLSSVGIFIVRAIDTNDTQEIKICIFSGFILVLFLSIPSMLLVWISPYSLNFLGQNLRVIENVKLFLDGLVWGIPGFLLFFVYREILAVFNLSRITMLVSITLIPITFFGNYILIYGKFGFPQLGIAGIGFAGSFVGWLMFFFSGFMLSRILD